MVRKYLPEGAEIVLPGPFMLVEGVIAPLTEWIGTMRDPRPSAFGPAAASVFGSMA